MRFAGKEGFRVLTDVDQLANLSSNPCEMHNKSTIRLQDA